MNDGVVQGSAVTSLSLLRVVLFEPDEAARHRLVRVLGRDARDGVAFRGAVTAADARSAYQDGVYDGVLVGGGVPAAALEAFCESNGDVPLVAIVPANDEARRASLRRVASVECVPAENLSADRIVWAFRMARERTAADRAHREERRAAERVSREKGQYVANVCHEIRAPLHVILGMSELLEGTQLSETQQTFVSRLRRAGTHLSTLVEDVVELARTEAGQTPIRKNPFALHDLVLSMVDFMGPTAHAKNVIVNVDYSPEVPKAVLGDARRVLQVLVNVLGNAIKFTERGSVRVSVTAPPDLAVPHIVRFAVTDTGIGIPAARLHEIYAAFVRVAPDGAPGGFGLGLDISKKLVERMGGRISVESVVGVGSTFTVDIPLEPSAPASPVENKPRAPAPADAERRAPRVLIVDDSADNRMLVEAYFSRTGMSLVCAEGGADAALKFANDVFDIVLMDLHMPDIDGFEATRVLRRIEAESGRRPVPIVALTADSLADSVDRCLEAGCTGHLSKPVGKEALLSTVREYLARARRSEPELHAFVAAHEA